MTETTVTLRCLDGIFTLTKRGGRLLLERVEFTPGSDFRNVNCTEAELRACFEGPAMARCIAVARLPPARFQIVFGRNRHPGHAQYGFILRRYGKRIVDPMVREHLKAAPLLHLKAAAQERVPELQIEAVARYQIQECLAKASKRKRRVESEEFSEEVE